MALGANSYGDTGEIAGLVLRFANPARVFDGTTRPTLAQVESFADQVSGVINIMLANAGFAIPITQADAVLMLDFFVNAEVAAMVEGVNGLGRFGPTTKSGGAKGRFSLIMEDVQAFIETFMLGIERMGVTRTYAESAGIAYRRTNEDGKEVFPVFTRKDFGNTFRDWDTS